MPDPLEPSQPPSPPPPPPPMPPDPSTRSTTTGLPSNIAAALACIPLVGGIIFYILEKRDGFVRFYAMQSIMLGAAWIVAWIVYKIAWGILTPIPAIGFFFVIILSIAWALLSIAFLVLFLVAMVKAFTNVRWDIPYIGPMARKQVGEV
jgi:uncharacterized membrane protein